MSHNPPSARTRTGTAYIWSVILIGLVIIGHAVIDFGSTSPGVEWFVLAALTLLTGSFTVKIPSLSARLSVSETFVFTSTFLFGVSAGTLTVVLDALVISFWLNKSSRLPARVLFNVAAPAIAIWSSATAFFTLSQVTPGAIQHDMLPPLLGSLFVFALLYFLINTWLVAGALATEQAFSPAQIWQSNFIGLSINYFVGCSIAALLVSYTSQIDLTIFGIIIPLLVISYITFRASMGRLEDATRHVAQLNDLYLSTIETLAVAVDAKDQITHGHIRRVQVYAIELAKTLGVADEHQLRAIEAAALLHDVGKLAIPEHILNKPGPLTRGEFDKMKRHSDIGADLLSSIPFPYPVVPLVRHHHENWDGTGYPHGISGTDIPLGARILAVVDCFDALTSDRPYRPRLTDDAAFDILKTRRGSMYDPLVVDAFLTAYARIAPLATLAGQQARTLIRADLELQSDSETVFNHIHAGAVEAAQLVELRRALTDRSSSIKEMFEDVAQVLRQLTPAAVIAFYTYVSHRDVLRCSYASGDVYNLLRGFEIPNGHRTTGWTAANMAASVNAAAALDLASLTERFEQPLRATLSVPIVASGSLAGVLTLYAPSTHSFDSSHRYLCEQIGSILAESLSRVDLASAMVTLPDFSQK